jgi:hypothetical protein
MRKWAMLACLLALAALAFAGASASRAAYALTTVHFDELAFQPVDGLTFKGVTYKFTDSLGNPSTDANFHGGGPGCGFPNTNPTIVCDPSLEGDATGTLTLTFARPTNVLKFGVAVSCFACFFSDGAHIVLYRVGPSPISTDIATSPPYCCYSGFSENLFSYSVPGVTGAVYKAVITFPEGGVSYLRFALDNLQYVSLYSTSALSTRDGAFAVSTHAPTWAR